MNFVITLEKERITSLKELGEKMYLYPDASEKLLTSSKFLKFLKENDEEKYVKLIELNHKEREHETFIFLAQYIFNPIMNIRHHGYEFNSYKELGEKILAFGPKIDVYLKDFLKFGLLTKYIKLMGRDIQDKEIYLKVVELEKKFKINANYSYFLLGFTLSDCAIITYESKAYSDVNLFFQEMIHDHCVANYSSLISKNQYVLAWLTYLGYDKVVDKYQSIINSITKLEENYANRTKNTKMEK